MNNKKIIKKIININWSLDQWHSRWYACHMAGYIPVTADSCNSNSDLIGVIEEVDNVLNIYVEHRFNKVEREMVNRAVIKQHPKCAKTPWGLIWEDEEEL